MLIKLLNEPTSGFKQVAVNNIEQKIKDNIKRQIIAAVNWWALFVPFAAYTKDNLQQYSYYMYQSLLAINDEFVVDDYTKNKSDFYLKQYQNNAHKINEAQVMLFKKHLALLLWEKILTERLQILVRYFTSNKDDLFAIPSLINMELCIGEPDELLAQALKLGGIERKLVYFPFCCKLDLLLDGSVKLWLGGRQKDCSLPMTSQQLLAPSVDYAKERLKLGAWLQRPAINFCYSNLNSFASLVQVRAPMP